MNYSIWLAHTFVSLCTRSQRILTQIVRFKTEQLSKNVLIYHRFCLILTGFSKFFHKSVQNFAIFFVQNQQTSGNTSSELMHFQTMYAS